MRQTLRQIVAVLALGGIALSLVPNALAATYTDLSAANKLAASEFIVDQSATPAAYRLGDTLLRQEGIKVAGRALNIVPADLDPTEPCSSRYTDVTEKWVCQVTERAAKAGLTVTVGKFRPHDTLSKYEAMALAFRSACTPTPNGGTVAGLGAQAADAGIITTAAGWNGTAAATRGEFFRYVASAMEDSLCGDTTDEDVLCSLFPDLCEDGGTPPTPTTGDVEVNLSNETPAGRTLPRGANGVLVASYDFTAGSEDALVSAVKLKREGVSDDADVTNFTVLVNGVRVTDSKDENSDDEVTLTLKNGGVTVDAGETVTLDVIVDIIAPLDLNSDGDYADAGETAGSTVGAEISVALVAVTTAGDVAGLPVVGETFRVGTATAPAIEILTDGSVSAPELGEVGADLFRFKVKNTNSNETVSLNGITFEQTGGIDETSELVNYKLMKGSEVLATVDSTDSKYVAFVLEEPLTITSGNNVALKVVADVVGGAGKTIVFGIDQKLDVMASSARYGSGTAVTLTASSFASVTVKAGAISLVKTDATLTKVREDKDSIVLGSLDIVAGQESLDVKKIAFAVAASAGNVGTYLDNVQLRRVSDGARYDLTGTANAGTVEFSDSSFDYSLAVGSNKFEVIADTIATIANFDTVNLTLSMVADSTLGGTDGYLVIEETGDDTAVTDITPSSLTWKKIEGSESGATVSVLPLSDLTKVRGAQNVTAMQFEIKADESSALLIDEIKASIIADSGGADIAATNQMVSQVALYEGTTTSGTPLDTVSGSNLAAGLATFDSFEVDVPANGKKTFTVTISFVDGTAAATNSTYGVSIAGANISATDDENDDVTISAGPYVSARDITVTNVGDLTLTPDANNADNQDAKNVLSGVSTKVFSVDVQATNEAIDVGKVDFTYSAGAGNLSAAGARAELYLGDTLVGTAPNSDITATHIIFGGTNAGELTQLIVPQETKELKLVIVSEPIGYEKVGTVVTGVDITNVATTLATGVSSGRDVANDSVSVATSSALFAVVPTVITPSSVATLSNSSASAKVKLTAASGLNTLTGSNDAPTASVDSLTFSMPGAVGVAATDYVLYEEGKSGDQIIGSASGSNVVFDFNNGVTATRTVTVGAAPANAETMTIGTCVVTFTTTAGSTVDELNCTDNAATIDTNTGAGDVARSAADVSAIVDTLTNVGSSVGLLTLTAGAANTTVFTASSAVTGTIVFTDGTTGDVTATNTVGHTVFANSDFSDNKTYVIVPTIATGETASLTLLESGVQYDVTGLVNDLVTSLPNELDFGTRTIN